MRRTYFLSAAAPVCIWLLTLLHVASACPQSDCDSLTARIAELSTKIARDEEAIRRLGFERRAVDFQEWAKLSADARAKLESATLDLL